MQTREVIEAFHKTTPTDVHSELYNLENFVTKDKHFMSNLDLLEEFGKLIYYVGHTRTRRKKYLQALFLYWKMKALMGRIPMEWKFDQYHIFVNVVDVKGE